MDRMIIEQAKDSGRKEKMKKIMEMKKEKEANLERFMEETKMRTKDLECLPTSGTLVAAGEFEVTKSLRDGIRQFKEKEEKKKSELTAKKFK